MIRLIQRRLIIPRGDTGSFTIPTQGTMEENDAAIFYIYDPMTKKSVQTIKGEINGDIITINFSREKTINLTPKRYYWDIVIYKNPIYDEDEEYPINGSEINSYYAGFSLPVCEIKEAANNYTLPPEALSVDQINAINKAINDLNKTINTIENAEVEAQEIINKLDQSIYVGNHTININNT